MALQRTYAYTPAANAEARRLIARAVALDPDFATALAVLSMTYSWDVFLAATDAPSRASRGRSTPLAVRWRSTRVTPLPRARSVARIS
jgi:hypothetical protein